MLFERFTTFMVVRFLWDRFPTLKNSRIASFASVEFNTSWHFRYSIPFLVSPEKRARMFEQLLEEYHHADLFLGLARKRSRAPVFLEPAEIKPIYSGRGDVWKLIVYSHVGEQGAVDRFSAVTNATADAELKKVVTEVLADEKGHTESVMGIAEEFGRTPAEIMAVERRVRLVRAWEAWLRHGNRVTNLVAQLALSLAYFACGPFLFLSARRRLSERLHMREDSLKRAI